MAITSVRDNEISRWERSAKSITTKTNKASNLKLFG